MRVSALSFFVLFALSAVAAGDPPYQTGEQIKLFKFWKGAAQEASAKAAPKVLALFSDNATSRWLHVLDDGTKLYRYSGAELMSMFFQALQRVELVHSFGTLDEKDANCGFDISLIQAMESSTFWNQWQAQALRLVPVDAQNNWFTEYAETTYFDFPPFANTSDPDMKTATSRPFYASLNFFKISGGNPQCGPIALVLNRRYLQGNVLVAPVDTGFYSGSCRDGQSVALLDGVPVARCSNGWSRAAERTLGTPGHLEHMLLPYLTFYNETESMTAGAEYPQYNLARLLIRLLSRKTYTEPQSALKLNFVENSLGYFEANPIVTIALPKAVRLVLGMYEVLWGTDQGVTLRTWCQQSNFPLAFAFNPSESYWRCGPSSNASGCVFPPELGVGLERANIRILDPSTFPAAVGDKSAFAVFQQFWTMYNVTNMTRNVTAVSWQAVSQRLFRELAIEPVYYGSSCADDCFGVFVVSGKCACN